MSETAKTVAVFHNLAEAEVAKTKLESEGIQCQIAGVGSVGLHILEGAVGKGIELKVKPADFHHAIKLLNATPES